MIFEAEQVTKLVIEWQHTQDPKLMEQILEQSKSLVEVIVSIYNPADRDDLQQEALLRLQYASKHFNKKYSLHNYFTTVIRNTCTTFSGRQSKDLLTEDIIMEGNMLEGSMDDTKPSDDDETLSNLKCRNRERFPSIAPNDCDEYTQFIYTACLLGESNRTVLREMTEKFCIPRHLALVFYNSTIVWLRLQNKASCNQDASAGEFTLAADLKSLVGEEVYKNIKTLFCGMNVKL